MYETIQMLAEWLWKCVILEQYFSATKTILKNTEHVHVNAQRPSHALCFFFRSREEYLFLI